MLKKSLLIIAFSLFTITTQAAVIIPPAPKVNAAGFILLDHHTGDVIAEQNADIRLAPASLTKIMTMYVVSQELKAGNIRMDDMVTISENAWAKNFPDSSKMFIEVGTEVKLADLLRGIVIQSGNDACVAVAEYVAGSQSAFADMMNAYAVQLGMTSTYFVNAHGLHDPEHMTTPRDMALLVQALIAGNPAEYQLYSEKEFTYNGIKQYNRNALLWDRSLNVDGVKTGHTSDAGYSLITSATQGDMRLISVVMGTESERARKEENKKLLRYGFRFFESADLFPAGHTFANHSIFYGAKDTVALGIKQPMSVTIPRGQAKNITAEYKLNESLEAPIEKGRIVGQVSLTLDDEIIATQDLIALETVEKGGFFNNAMDYFKQKVSGEE